MEKRWHILEAPKAKTEALQEALKISPTVCRILVERGIETFEAARRFFRPQLSDLHDPWLMKDMDKAVDRIIRALEHKEKILVYGDYDVDGTTSVACMFRFLQGRAAPECLDFYIPHRYREGYGISRMGIDFARDNGFSLIISLDCGIKSAELIGYAAGLGIDFIVCDHHLPEDILPPAIAILNPKQSDCLYPYKDLCGCGVGFKLITALARRLGVPDSEVFVYLDLVATAIAADIVPMTGENRILAFHGMEKVNVSPNHGIRALINLSKLEGELSIMNLVFMIAPRVNAAGRMDDAKKAVLMFVAPTYQEALHYANMLHSDNSDRKEADLSITEEALAIIETDPVLVNKKTTVVFQPHWHKGVVGIVASRLIERYYRPTIVLTLSGELASGSARSVPGFNLYEAIHACREYLLGYGGHFAAAGMTLLPHHIKAFSEKFEEVVSATIDPALLIPQITIDAVISLKEVQPSLYRILQQMEPFGPSNARPVFLARGVMDTGHSSLLKGQHIRFSLRQDESLCNGIGFNMPEKFKLLESRQPLDIVFTIDENEWKQEKRLQLKVIDLKPSQNN